MRTSNPNSCSLLPVLLVAALLAPAPLLRAVTLETITFDDLTGAGLPPVPNGYGGLQWDQFNWCDYTTSGSSGFSVGVVSLRKVAFNAYGNPAQLSSSSLFSLDSAYLAGAWNDGLNVEVQGFVGSTLAYDSTYVIDATGPSLINFNYVGITRAVFTPSGGVNHGWRGLGGGGDGPVFVMDNLTVELNAVPEPSACTLAALGSLVLLFRHSRFRFPC